jgi:hypothetical protein
MKSSDNIPRWASLITIKILALHSRLGCVCFPESGFQETTFQIFLFLFVIKKFGQRKTLSDQRKILYSQRKI